MKRLLPELKTLDRERIQSILLVLLVVASVTYPLLYPHLTNAAVTEAYYRPDRMAANTAANGSVSGAVCLKTATSGTESSMTITFPSGWTLDTTTSNWTLDTSATNIPAGATQWPTTSSGNATAADNTAKTVTFTVGDLSSTSTLYCLHFTAAGSTTTSVSGNDQTGTIATNVDSTGVSYATAQTSSSTADQVSVTASVPGTFSFSLSPNSVALGSLSTSSVTSGSTVTATVSTNARNGWQAWVKNSSNGLYSTAASAAIPAPGSYGSTYDLSSTTGYGLDVNSGTGTPTVDTAYDGSNSTSVGVLQSSFEPIATKATPGSGDTVDLVLRAKISATQQAASDYTDTLTVVAAGQF